MKMEIGKCYQVSIPVGYGFKNFDSLEKVQTYTNKYSTSFANPVIMNEYLKLVKQETVNLPNDLVVLCLETDPFQYKVCANNQIFYIVSPANFKELKDESL